MHIGRSSKLAIAFLFAFALLFLSACNSSKYDYSAKRSLPDAKYGSTYTVKRGDTLYSIAWAIKQDHRRLASWNGIKAPYLIKVGQRLRMYPPSSKAAKTYKKAPATSKKTKSASHKKKKSSSKKASYKSSAPTARVKYWRWPTVNHRVTSRFNPAAGKDGIDIVGKFGDAVYATADGQVVYAGSGLRGYGRLIILKHNKTYLSAYAHNESIVVAEGQSVKAGKKIGRMGNNGKGQAALHFEIRKNGKPVNPSGYLSVK